MKLRKLAVPLAGLALGIPATALADTSTTTTQPAPASTIEQRWHAMENGIDRIFSDAMQDLHLTGNSPTPGQASSTQPGNAQFGSSIDIREKPDAYEARVYVPKADIASTNVTLKDGTLNITAGDKTSGNYEESVQLPGPVLAEKMKIENKDGFLLVTIPKDKSAAAAKTIAPATSPAQTAGQWDSDIVREMQRMQDRMDQFTRDALAGIPGATDTTGATSPVAGAGITGGLLDSSVKLDDQKNQYVAHFYLPDTDTANVKVNVNGDELRLSATNESKKETTGANGAQSQYSAESNYQEEVTLPGPVHADRMTVDRKAGVVTVTLPKA
ncbi:MAG TPA: Hsp20 family protein [Chthoniobacteraceae bacterium]|nr:Hsp20 family protein [Chthoniobacteraceae bacterium]